MMAWADNRNFSQESRVRAGVSAREAGTFSDVSTITGVSRRKSVNPHSKVCCKYLLYINLILTKETEMSLTNHATICANAVAWLTS